MRNRSQPLPSTNKPEGNDESEDQLMKCPFCAFLEDKVVDSRESREGDAIRRRRECLKCERRFTSYERIDHIAYMVTKKDESREAFDRNKVMAGLFRACVKRAISPAKIGRIVKAVRK